MVDGDVGLRMNRVVRLLAGACAVVFACGLSPVAVRADERPLARVVLMPELIPQIARQLVPMTIELPPGRVGPRATRIEVVSLVYCGSDGDGGAWALLAGYPDGAAAQSPSRAQPGANMLSAADCRAALPALAQRLAHSADAAQWTEVIRTHVTWVPWTLRLAVVDAAGARRDGSPAPPLKESGQFKSFPTLNLRLLPPPGQENRFDVAVGFLPSSIVVAVFSAGRIRNPEAYLKGDPVLEAELADAPARANAVADAQYGFINALLRLYAPSFEFPLQLQGMTQRLVVRNVSASGGDHTMTVSGQLELGNVSYDAAVHCEGDDLAIRQVTMVAPAVKCDNSNLMAQLQCQGQQAASGAFGPMLTGIYQGQRFHYSTVDRPLRFTLGDATFAARFEALRSSSRGSTVNEDGVVTIERTDRAPGLPR
jgi:hypothetical protein